MESFDEEAQPLTGGAPDGRANGLKTAARYIRRGFVRKVYGVLTLQLLLTVAIGAYIYTNGQTTDWLRSHEWLLWASVALTMSAFCVMMCCEQVCRQYPTNYLFLFGFTACEAVMIGFVSVVFTWESLLLAAGLTVLIFVGLSIYAFNTDTDFTGAGPYLFAGLLCFGVFGIALALLPTFGIHIQIATAIYDLIGVLLFTFYIIFDTQLMMGEYGGHRLSLSIDDYVFAALNLYTDILNLFLHMLSLLAERR